MLLLCAWTVRLQRGVHKLLGGHIRCAWGYCVSGVWRRELLACRGCSLCTVPGRDVLCAGSVPTLSSWSVLKCGFYGVHELLGGHIPARCRVCELQRWALFSGGVYRLPAVLESAWERFVLGPGGDELYQL